MTLTYTLLCVLLMVISWMARGYWDRLRRRYAKPRPIDLSHVTISSEEFERFREDFEARFKDLPDASVEIKGYFSDKGPIDG